MINIYYSCEFILLKYIHTSVTVRLDLTTVNLNHVKSVNSQVNSLNSRRPFADHRLKTNELCNHHTKVEWDRPFTYEYIYWCLYCNINVNKLQQSMYQNISFIVVLLFLHRIALVSIAEIYDYRLSLLSCPWAWQ